MMHRPHVHYRPIQWRSKALSGPGSTVTWGPSIPSAGTQGLKLEARSAESVFFTCVKILAQDSGWGAGARGPGSFNRLNGTPGFFDTGPIGVQTTGN